MKIIAVIPARYQASRFPGKLMKELGGKSVILRTFESTLQSKLFDEVFVATDSDLIAQEIKKHGGKVVMSKKNHATGSDRIAEAIENIDAEIIVNVQGDEPFTKKEILFDLINVFKNDINKEISVATLKHKLEKWEDISNPNNVKIVTDNQGFALYFSRSPVPYPQNKELKNQYYKHIGIYAFRKQALLDYSKLPMRINEASEKIEAIRFLEYGMKIKCIPTDEITVGIDTPEDLERAKSILKNKNL